MFVSPYNWIILPLHRSSKELLLQPVMISRNEKEKVLIEGSINSVRVSIAVKQVTNKLLLPQHGCVWVARLGKISRPIWPNLATQCGWLLLLTWTKTLTSVNNRNMFSAVPRRTRSRRSSATSSCASWWWERRTSSSWEGSQWRWELKNGALLSGGGDFKWKYDAGYKT